jgi:hypothetical protein
MSETRDFYPEGEQAPGIIGAQAKDWIPPAHWNEKEGRVFTAAELAPPVEEVPAVVSPVDEGMYAASTLIVNPLLVNRTAYTCSTCPEGAREVFPTMQLLMRHRKDAHEGFRCRDCHEVFPSLAEVVTHRKDRHVVTKEN